MFNFYNSIKLLFLRSFDFKGRSSRAEFAWAALAVGLVCCALLYPFYDTIAVKTGPALSAIWYGLWIGDMWPSGGLSLNFKTTFFPITIFVSIIFIPFLSLLIRRLHDLDMSAKFLGILILAPLFPGLGLGILLVTSIQLGLKGTKGSNSYGPDPYGHNSESRAVLSFPALKSPGVFD